MASISPVHEDTRVIFLERCVPKWAWPYTCRCRKTHALPLDATRNMYVCEVCRLPAGFKLDTGNTVIMEVCIDCEDNFIVWIANLVDPELSDMRCDKCGGSNAAAKGQRTPDPMKTPIEGIDD